MSRTDSIMVDGRRVVMTLGKSGLPPDRPMLLLVHGSGGSHQSWGAQINPLGRKVRLAAVDLPGHGGSDGPPLESVAAYADWLIRAVRVMDPPKRPILAGISLGGAVVLEAALLRPDLWSGLVLISTSAHVRVDPELTAVLERDYKAGLDFFIERLFAPETLAKFGFQSLEILKAAPRGLLLADLAAGRGFDRRDRIGEIDLPALVVCGREDRITPPEKAEELAARLPRARLEVIEGAGHMVQVEKIQEVNRLILEFVEMLSCRGLYPRTPTGGPKAPPDPQNV